MIGEHFVQLKCVFNALQRFWNIMGLCEFFLTRCQIRRANTSCLLLVVLPRPCLLSMVNHRISNDIKEVGLSLWEKGWDILDICEALYVSQTSLYHWRAIFEEHGSVTRPPSPLQGRICIISCAVLEAIHAVYKSDPDIYLDELQYWLAIHYNIAISIPALHQNLEDAGLMHKMLHKIASERDEVLRTEWRNNIAQNFSGMGDELVFADKISKNDHSTGRCFGRALAGKRANLDDVFV